MQVVIRENAGYTFSIFSILPINPRPASYSPRMHVVQQVQVFKAIPMYLSVPVLHGRIPSNRCGETFEPPYTCACDEHCQFFGDCCQDFRWGIVSGIDNISLPLEFIVGYFQAGV